MPSRRATWRRSWLRSGRNKGYAISQGQTRAWAIARFLEAQTAYLSRQEIEARRDRGENLTIDELKSLARPLVVTSEDGFHLAPARIELANDRGAKPTVSRRTIYDWFKARDSEGVVALSPAPTKIVQPIPKAFGVFLKFYAIPSKPSVSDAHLKYMEDAAKRSDVQLMTLTLSQCRHILRDRLNNIEKHVGREGLLTLRSRMAYVTRTTEDMWPTTIYSADGKTFDAEVADPVTRLPIRPEITTVIDIVTRKVVGTSFARSENQRYVAEALRNACVTGGIPIQPIADKNLRIERLQPPIAAGLIRFAPTHTTLIDQLQQWPNGDHDDGPDCLDMLWQNTLIYAGGGAMGQLQTASAPSSDNRLGGYRLGGRG